MEWSNLELTLFHAFFTGFKQKKSKFNINSVLKWFFSYISSSEARVCSEFIMSVFLQFWFPSTVNLFVSLSNH